MRQLTVPGVERRSGVEMTLRDGTVLVCDLYLPSHRERAPALVQRTPYGRVWATGESFAPPAWYASRGFAVVCQDVRGCGDSGGDFAPFEHEAEDGGETIAWVASQPWCSGAVGTYGFSYPGVIQLLTAALKPPALRAVAPAMATSSVHTPWLYRGGAFQLAWVHRWICDLGGAAARRAGDQGSAEQFARLAADPASLFGTLPVDQTFDPALLCHVPFLAEWRSRPADDDYWARISPQAHYEAIDVPALHVTGWYDTFLDGAVQNYRSLKATARAEQILIAGPWRHVPWQRKSNGFDFGESAASPVDEAQVAFFRRWLRDDSDEPAQRRPVHVFVMGEDRWRELPDWPADESQRLSLHLVSGGRANSSGGDGRLVPGPSRQSLPPDILVTDPGFPVELPGGRSCCYADVTPMGPADQSEEHQRNDVLIYALESPAEEVIVVGSPRLTVFIASDRPSVDLIAQLSTSDALGRWVNVSDGNVRVGIGDEVVELLIELSATAFSLRPGQGLRLALAGSCFPTLDLNPHTGASAMTAPAQDLAIATTVVLHDTDHRSRLDLPILCAEEALGAVSAGDSPGRQS